MDLVFTCAIREVTRVARRVGRLDNGTILCMRPRPTGCDGSPEIVQHVPVKSDPLTRGEPNFPDAQREAKVVATLADGTTAESDLFIAADGSGSKTRRRMLPDIDPRYAGYVAWRGTIEEKEVRQDLLTFFDDMFTFSEAQSSGHMSAYFIPGSQGEAVPGLRRLNWVWYVHVDPADLPDLLMRSISASTRAIAARVAAENGLDLSCANSKGIAVHITATTPKQNPADNSNARMHDRVRSAPST
jgi:hypothetical protein